MDSGGTKRVRDMRDAYLRLVICDLTIKNRIQLINFYHPGLVRKKLIQMHLFCILCAVVICQCLIHNGRQTYNTVGFIDLMPSVQTAE